LLSANGLTSRSILRVGQVLELPGGKSSAASRAPIEVAYTVRPGDTPCQIAERFDMPCDAFQRMNNLKRHGVIYVGQVVKVHGTAGASGGTSERVAKAAQPDDDAQAHDTAGEAATSPLDSDLRLDIRTRRSGNDYRHYITVEPEETLGHYADWLGIGSVASIKQLNGIGNAEALVSGSDLSLPVATDTQKATFNRKRQEYHRVLAEEFKENYRVLAVENYKVRIGDSAWAIANRFELPLWVLTRYNPELRSRSPSVGEMLKIPRIESRG
jgi:membrane-bound lytic murein transglycosylase D